MPLLSSTDWPIRHDDPWENSQPGGVAPLRHDLALAAYLQRQQAWRASAVRNPSASAIRWCGRVLRAWRFRRVLRAEARI